MKGALSGLLALAAIWGLYSNSALAHDNTVVIPMFEADVKTIQTIIRVAKNNGDFASPVAAINSITDASATNPYLIVIAPGVYTLTETLIMKEYVGIAGSGQNVTKLTGAIVDISEARTAIFFGANNSELRDLSIENTSDSFAVPGVYNSSASPSMSNLTITVSGESSYNTGVRNSSASPRMNNITINISGGSSRNTGVDNVSASPNMNSLTINVNGGGAVFGSIGVMNQSSSPSMSNLTISSSGGNPSLGVKNSSASPVMSNLIINASGGPQSQGLYNHFSSPTIRNSYIEGETRGVHNTTIQSKPNISQSSIVNGVSNLSSVCTFVDDGQGNELNADCVSL